MEVERLILAMHRKTVLWDGEAVSWLRAAFVSTSAVSEVDFHQGSRKTEYKVEGLCHW